MNVTWCRPPACLDAANTDANYKVCDNIKKYGLDNVPSGYIYNSPYPDDQSDMSLMYPNQDLPPKRAHPVCPPRAHPVAPSQSNQPDIFFGAVFTVIASITSV